MSREIGGILVSRLIVLICLILIPISTFSIFIVYEFQLWYTNDPTTTFWITKVLCPIVFCLSWLFFIGLFLNRLAMTFDSMDKTVSIIPLRLKMFYGAIALIVLFIFVLPLITPLIAIISFMSIAWQITTHKKDNWGEKSKTPFFTRFLMIIFAILPIFCAASIINGYLGLSYFLSKEIWDPLTMYVYILCYCLCTALAVGSLFVLAANKGVSEYESILVEKTQKKKMWYVHIIELGLFVFLLLLAIGELPIINFFYTAGFILIILVSIINYFTEGQKTGKYKSHILGYLLAAVFMGSNFLFDPENLNILGIISMIVLSGVFIIVFIVTFITLEESEF